MMRDTDDRAFYAVKSLPLCERCGAVRATASLTFSYRDEPYAEHFYCSPCCDLAWDEGVATVDAKAAALRQAGLDDAL